MLDIGWQELMVVGVLALLVVGPKELPGLLRTVGQWVGRARSVARDFQRSMDEAAREADLEEFRKLKDVKREVENLARVDYAEQARRSQSYMTSPKPAAGTGTPAAGGTAAPAGSAPAAPAGSAPAAPASPAAVPAAPPAAAEAPPAAPADTPKA